MGSEYIASIRDLQWDTPRPVILVHGDVDGMVTACIFLRGSKDDAEVRFTGARRLSGDLQALSNRIQEDLPVSEVLIGNVPVRPPAIGAVRQILAADVPVTWVDHHATRQPLLDEVNSLKGMTFLHDAEMEAPPSSLAARALELDDEAIDRLMSISNGKESEDEWVRDRHTLLAAQIGHGQPAVVHRVAGGEDLCDEDRETIELHLKREAAADALVDQEEHPGVDLDPVKLVIIDGREQDVGYLPRRVEARYPDVGIRCIIPDDSTLMVTSAERSWDLVRLLRGLPWPDGIFVGGRPYHARIDPGDLGIDAVLEVIKDVSAWPEDISAAAARQPRNKRNARNKRPKAPRGGGSPKPRAESAPGPIQPRGFFEQMVEQRLLADLLLDAWRNDERIEVLRAGSDDAGFTMILESFGIIRHTALVCTMADARLPDVPVALALADKPEGCVIWAEVENDPQGIRLIYHWLGSDPGRPIIPLGDFKRIGGDRGPASAVLVPRGKFTHVPSIHALSKRLFD